MVRSYRLLRFDDNKSAASCQQAWCKLIIETFIHKLDASWLSNLQQVCKYQVATSLIFTDVLQLVDNLQQAGKIHKFRNLQQVCGVSGSICYAHIIF